MRLRMTPTVTGEGTLAVVVVTGAGPAGCLVFEDEGLRGASVFRDRVGLAPVFLSPPVPEPWVRAELVEVVATGSAAGLGSVTPVRFPLPDAVGATLADDAASPPPETTFTPARISPSATTRQAPTTAIRPRLRFGTGTCSPPPGTSGSSGSSGSAGGSGSDSFSRWANSASSDSSIRASM